jgi:hypothetical protein
VGVKEILMKKRNVMFGAAVASLSITGFVSGFMVALLHLMQGDFYYMGVLVVVMAFGCIALLSAVKQGREMLVPSLQSNVMHYEGPCVPVWLNDNQVCHRMDGGVSGFFKMVTPRWYGRQKYGEDFHGIMRGGVVESTKEAMVADEAQRSMDK